ncbi:MAG TPA: hypothetical protein VLF60_00945 [Candidatus Saccharimonadales bacterium]|nr:hypothetical protein [Candidatus Saccharimonadales bacterium]
MKAFSLKLTSLVVAIVALFGVMSLAPALAQPAFADSKGDATNGVNDTGSSGGLSIPKLISNVTSILAYFVGIASVIMIVISGFKYVTSNGDSGSVQSAKNTLIYAIVGLVVAIFAQVIVKFVIGKLT